IIAIILLVGLAIFLLAKSITKPVMYNNAPAKTKPIGDQFQPSINRLPNNGISKMAPTMRSIRK
ncbi:TPA: hypothetical protein DCG61_01555, partial [Patescibacteria group bacterium]|nr:hypothetical protein [Patescibacteria group bacterium]